MKELTFGACIGIALALGMMAAQLDRIEAALVKKPVAAQTACKLT